MATRADDTTAHRGLTRKFTVATGQTVTKGQGVIFASSDTEIQVSGANGKSFGVALESGTAGQSVEVAMHGFNICKVKVGTGGATRGEYAITVADGYTNQTLGGGNTVRYIAGLFLQSGVAGDEVAMLQSVFAAGSA